jgi:hypothetical protein
MHAGFHQNCLREYNALVTNFWIRVLNKILRIF